jgi:hypothetical protein
MNIEETMNKVDNLLTDRGLTKEYEKPAVRQMLLYLYSAIDIYRYMKQAEKNDAGFWFRKFKNSFTLRNFLKERKRPRERKNPPYNPLIRKDHLEKELKTPSPIAGAKLNIESRQKAFWDACLNYEQEYGRQLLLKFFCYWAEEVKGTGLMLWETKRSWNMKLRLKAWSKKSFEFDAKAAALRLERAKAKATPKQPTIDAAEREEANARLEREIAERKASAVPYEEYLKMKH